MFYCVEDGYFLFYNFFKVIILLCFIVWILMSDIQGNVNFVFYFFFNGILDVLMQVMFVLIVSKFDQDDIKDIVVNICVIGEFCVNIVLNVLQNVMNILSVGFDKDVDEFQKVGLMVVYCNIIGCLCVFEVFVSFECKFDQIVMLKGVSNFMVIGEVIGVYLCDECIVDGIFDVIIYEFLVCLGYWDYVKVFEVFLLV